MFSPDYMLVLQCFGRYVYGDSMISRTCNVLVIMYMGILCSVGLYRVFGDLGAVAVGLYMWAWGTCLNSQEWGIRTEPRYFGKLCHFD